MQVSKIAEIDASNKNITKIIVFDKTMKDADLKTLIEEFDYGKELVDKSTKIYRSVALIMDLVKMDKDLSAEWQLFLEKYFPKRAVVSKLDNVFVSKNYNKLLLITNRRLVTVDIRKLNEKIMQVNNDIDYYNASLEKEMPQEPERKTFKDIIKSIFR